MLEILAVEPHSIAEELGLEAGDRLQALNGQPVRDFIDYQLLSRGEELLIEVERADGELWELDIEKDADDPLGLVLPHPEPTECGNNCIFCFVHQLPPGMRRSLYVKDEDYRFSFLYGAYVTLTNIGEEALERILAQHLSPLYVSVHTTNELLRQEMLGRQALPIMAVLRRLVAGGIEIHAQIVICPDFNDGEELEQTYADLVSLAPGVRSLALVPVGLTGFREKLPDLRPFSAEEAGGLLDWAHARQAECLERGAGRFIFAADELYLAAGAEFPTVDAYEDFSQIENGVGLVAAFRFEANKVLQLAKRLDLPAIDLVTGVSAATELENFARQLNRVAGTNLKVHVVSNRFFGGQVTVTGLLTGQDLLAQLAGKLSGNLLLLPDVVLRDGEDVLLDDLRVADLGEQLDIQVEVIPSDPWGIWDMLEVYAEEFQQAEPGPDHGGQ